METRNQDASPVGIYCRWSASTGSALGHAGVAHAAEGTPAEVAASWGRCRCGVCGGAGRDVAPLEQGSRGEPLREP